MYIILKKNSPILALIIFIFLLQPPLAAQMKSTKMNAAEKSN